MCSCKCVSKFILIVVNLIFLLAGALMLSFGITAKVRPDLIFGMLNVIPDFDKVSPAFDLTSIINGSAIFMIVLGVIVFLIGFFGCFGACCESVCLLTTYLIVLLVVLCGEVALIIFAAVSPQTFRTLIQDIMKKSLAKFNDDIKFNGTLTLPANEVSLGWSILQLKTKCCGANGYSDYKAFNVTINGKTYYDAVPLSCCKTTQDVDLAKTYRTPSDVFVNYDACLRKDPAYINTLNCYDSIYELIKKSTAIAIGIAAGIVGAQIILIISTICICRAIKKGDD